MIRRIATRCRWRVHFRASMTSNKCSALAGVGANPSRRDGWPAYRPTRHVLILRKRRYERPWQGYVVDWKHHSYKWGALVVHQDETLEGSPLAWKWFPVEQLRPMYPDPNPRTELNY